jgi:hypothetical protein
VGGPGRRDVPPAHRSGAPESIYHGWLHALARRHWQSCCVDHDMVYWCGGSSAARRLADEKFCSCIAAKGGGVTASIMYWGVRLGGHPWLPTYWRWGYGWSWPRGYTDD